jgi:hypothetical protein
LPGEHESKEIKNAATGRRIVFLRAAEETGRELLEMDDFWANVDHQTPNGLAGVPPEDRIATTIGDRTRGK